MFDGPGPSTVELTLYTDALTIEGSVRSDGGSLVQLLSDAGDFLTVEEARVDEHASRGNPVTASFVRVRLDEVRFALAELAPRPDPEAAQPAQVMLAVPPFVVTGRLGLPDRGEGIRETLAGLSGGFVEVVNGAYVSEPMNVSQRRSPVIVVNVSRIQAMAPHRDVDPWAGLDRSRAADLVPAGVVTDGDLAAETEGEVGAAAEAGGGAGEDPVPGPEGVVDVAGGAGAPPEGSGVIVGAGSGGGEPSGWR